MSIAQMKELLKTIPVDLMKQEIERRRQVERAKRHLPSAEAALKRAQSRLDVYRKVLKDDEK